MKPLEWVLAVLLAVLTLLFATRGGLALWSGVYEGSSRSGPYILHGTEAIWAGLINILLGGIIAAALRHHLKTPPKS